MGDGLEVDGFEQSFAASAPPAAWRAGARVQLHRGHHTATVRFYGETEFADGLWVGLELGRYNATTTNPSAIYLFDLMDSEPTELINLFKKLKCNCSFSKAQF